MMAATGIDASVVVYPDPALDSQDSEASFSDLGHETSPDSFGLDVPGSRVTTLYTASVARGDSVAGFLYVPFLPVDDPCLSTLPANATAHDTLANSDFDAIAFAPWLSRNCSSRFLSQANDDPSDLKAFLFYVPSIVTSPLNISINTSTEIPAADDEFWAGVDYGAYTFPVYAVSPKDGGLLMTAVAAYARNITSSSGNDTGPRNYARVYTEIDTGASVGLPGLWIFLLTILGIAVAVVVTISFTMHCIQRRRRQELQRRWEAGEIDMEGLGVLLGHGTRPTVPKRMLDTIPIKLYSPPYPSGASNTTSHASALSPSPSSPQTLSSAPPPPPKPDAPLPALCARTPAMLPPDPPLPPDPTLPLSLSLPSPPPLEETATGYDQTTCPICLDAFVALCRVRCLPCNHIFHPQCIDRHLQTQSAKCPLCARSALPLADVPVKIDNRMVRRWRAWERERRRQQRERRGTAWGRWLLGGRAERIQWAGDGERSRRAINRDGVRIAEGNRSMWSRVREWWDRRGGRGAAGGQEMLEMGRRQGDVEAVRRGREEPDDDRREGKLRRAVGKVFPGFR